jgi:Helix-turn-helix domain
MTTLIGEHMFGGLIPSAPKTYAAWPVWHDSTTREVKFQPMSKKAAAKVFHKARAFERQTRPPGHQDGADWFGRLKGVALLLFDSLNYLSGALYPSYATIAKNAATSVSSVGRGLKKLKEAGVINWLRRCKEEWIDGRFTLKQESNTYAVLPSSQWIGFSEPPEAPTPEPGTWGDHPPSLPAIFNRTRGDLTTRHLGRFAPEKAGKSAVIRGTLTNLAC